MGATPVHETGGDDDATLTSSRRRHPWLRRVLWWVLGLSAAVVLASVAWAFVEPHLLLVDRSTVVSPDLPAPFDGTRIVFASDVHAGDLLGERRVARVVDGILAERPDMIMLGGDYVGGGENGVDLWVAQLDRLRAPLGTYAVLGNHDGGAAAPWLRSAMETAGVTLLDNRNVRVVQRGGWLRVAGVEDHWEGHADLEAAATDIGRGEFAILVTHNPDPLADGLPKVEGAFDLVLAGHTHGGQVTAFGLWAPLTPSEYGSRYRTGWRTERGVPILVSNGTGVYGRPVRFFAPPQIHVIQLRSGTETRVVSD